MNLIVSRNGGKFIFAVVVMGALIIGGVTAALALLREEAIRTHLKIAKLHAATFSEHLAQTMGYVDYTLDAIAISTGRNEGDEKTAEAMTKALKDAPYIRSISILDTGGLVVASSNQKNIGRRVSLSGFIPIPVFDDTIPRFSKSALGRDIESGVDIKPNSKIAADALTYIPFLKKTSIGGKDRYFFVALNGDYFLRKYLDGMDAKIGYADLLLIDGTTLASTDKKAAVGGRDPYATKVLSVGLEFADVNDVGARKTLDAYAPTKNFPLAVSVRLDYDKTLKEWEKQRLNVLMVTTALVILSAALTLLLIIRYKKQQLLEEKILRSKMSSMSEMISMIAHQWRQPLAILSGINANILDAYEYEELTEEYLRQKNEQANGVLKYLSKTIDDFRLFFRPDEEKKEFCICEATKESLKLSYPQMSAAGVKLYFNGARFDEEASLECDEKLLFFGYRNEFIHSVLAILKNSFEAINRSAVANGEIKVFAVEKREYYLVEIADNGGGVKEEISGKLFDPYFTTKHDYIGVGMGLYVAKTAVEKNMNGRIYFKNENNGARFFIELKKEWGDK